MIRFENVVKSFGDRVVLKGISFEIQQGEIVFIIGTSGVGKSVLLKSVVGLLRPTSGRIWVDDEDVSQMTEEEFFRIRKTCGMVFQHPALFDSFSVFENIAFGLRRHYDLSEDEIKKKVNDALALVNLSGVKGKRPQEISYGVQKRVSLARTIVVDPKVLLFDEPTTGLDPMTTNVINQLILSLSRKLKTTSVVVSHDINCALEIADRIIVLDEGRIAAQGDPHQLQQSESPLVKDFLLEVPN